MPVQQGSRWGPYEILDKLGAGGMGEVYLARDTRLGRTVAIKVVAAALATSPEARRRFEQEARAVAALNHPHICVLYDVGREGAVDFLVMEYLEGRTLAARLARGPLGIDEALSCAIDVAQALAVAHRERVCHRDLKPGNIMLTRSGAKVLDFGLARIAEDGHGAVVSGDTPTEAGAVVGTLPYMAPEQLAGEPTGAASDIFAFGAVLYEMLTGRRAFAGETRSSVIAAVMSSDPPAPSTYQPDAPAVLDQIVSKCLAKDPRERWQSAQDLADALQWIVRPAAAAGPARTQPGALGKREKFAWALVALLLIAVAGVGALLARIAPPIAQTVRFRLLLPDKVALRSFDFPVVAPDGQHVAFAGAMPSAGLSGVWVRPLRSLDAQQVAAGPQLLADTTSSFVFPFWSPDGRSLAFFGQGKLTRVEVAGGAPVNLCDFRLGRGGSWGKDDVILFAESGGRPIQAVPAGGGQPRPVTNVEPSRGERDHSWPQFLPDGNHFLYFVSGSGEARGIYAGSLTSSAKKRVADSDVNGAYARGHLLFMRGAVIMAQKFDVDGLRVTGEPVPVADSASRISGAVNSGGAGFTASEGGVLAYLESAPAGNEMVWFDRQGRRTGTLGDAGDYSNPALSRDGASLAIGHRDLQTGARDIWIFDVRSGTGKRATFDPADDLNPAWSPDGRRIAFTSTRGGGRDLYATAIDGAGADSVVWASAEEKSLEDWSPDGQSLVFNDAAGHLQAFRFSDRTVMRLTDGPGIQVEARLSPNGRWLAYRSIEGGRSEIFVESFPPGAGRWQVSTGGGAEPAWRADGRELFFLIENKLMAVETETRAEAFRAGIPKELFVVRGLSSQFRNRYVPSPDGRSFLLVLQIESISRRPFVVVLNWQETLTRR